MEAEISKSKVRRWWGGSCGIRELLVLALPLVVSMMSFALNQFFDRLFLTWHSTTAVAAVIQAGAMAWLAYSFPLGLIMYTTAFVAQYFGSGNYSRIGRVLVHAIYLSLVTIPIYLLLGLNSEALFATLRHSSGMQQSEVLYFRILTYSLGLTITAEALSAYFIGIGRTAPVMIANVASALINIVLDYLLIFGIGDWSGMGIAGAAWATTIANWFKLAVFVFLVARSGTAARDGLTANWRLSANLIGRLLRFGGPQGLHFFLEGAAITAFIILVGGISESASAATSIALSVNMVAFVPVFGLGTGVTTLVGREIGHGRIDLAKRATQSALLVGIIYTGIFAAAYLFFPSLFIALHQSAGDQKPELETVRWLLRFVAAYCVFDAIQMLYQAAIKGAGDTLYVLIVTIISSTAFVLFGLWGARWYSSEVEKLNWWWWTLTSWIIGLSIAYFLRYRGGRWTRMSVIESSLIAHPSAPGECVPLEVMAAAAERTR